MILPHWLLQTAVATQFYFYGKKHFTARGWQKASGATASATAVPATLAAGGSSSTTSITSSTTNPYHDQEDLGLGDDLAGRTYAVTGASSGIGRTVTELLAARGATVYMVCRNERKAVAVRDEIAQAQEAQAQAQEAQVAARRGPVRPRLHVVVADVGVRADVERAAAELDRALALQRERGGGGGGGGLDGLVCNAGALLAQRTLTREGLEVTAATHLVHGTYLLTERLRPALLRAPDPRVVVVSSGGMLTARWPGMAAASAHSLTDTGHFKPQTEEAAAEAAAEAAYDGQRAYAYAKRGQVLLVKEWAKRWARTAATGAGAAGAAAAAMGGNADAAADAAAALAGRKEVKVVACHPGWVDTPGVQGVYGRVGAWLLAPLRSLYQGSEGVAWLAACGGDELESGAFYLDRRPQPIHLPGGWLFNRGGTFTQNSQAEIDALLASLETAAAASSSASSAAAAACESPER